MLHFCERSTLTFKFRIQHHPPIPYLRSFSSSSTFSNLSSSLQGHIPHSHLLQIHARILILGAHQDNLIATRLIGRYPSPLALRVFSQLSNPNIFPFNAIIRVLGEDNLFRHAFSVFKTLKRRSLYPNDFTFSFLLKACFCVDDLRYLKQIHNQIVKLGYLGDPVVCNGLLAVYAKGFRDLESAHKVFDEMPERSSVCCWTSLIAGCAQAGRTEDVLSLFCKMVEADLQPEDDTMVSVLSACSNLEMIKIEKWVILLSGLLDNVHGKSIGDSVNTVLVYLYGKWGNIERTRKSFDEIDDFGIRSVLPWNAMMAAYVQNGCPVEAVSLFRLMMENPTRKPNHVTMVSVLSACAQIGDLDLGTWVHQYMKSKGRKGILETNTFLATTLIDMYSKCGCLEKAKEVFYQMVSKDVISFNAMIMGLATNGEGEEAVCLFSQMLELGLKPNAGTFLGLLSACNHSGLSEEGRRIFLDMTSRFSVPPRLEHYACYIDLLSRVGLVEEALQVVESMPFEPNNFVWGALLGGCLLHSRADLAEKAYKKLVEVDPENSGGYLMLANMLAVDEKWNEVSIVRWLMREKGVRKQPGHSWISVDGVMHEFVAGYPQHPQMESIHNTLTGLIQMMMVIGT